MAKIRRMARSPGCRFCTGCGWNCYTSSSRNFRSTRVRETPRRAENLRVLVTVLRFTISRTFSCSSTRCWRARSDETWALGSVSHSRNVLNTLENTLLSGILRIGTRRRYSSTATLTLLSQKPSTYSYLAYSAFVKRCGILHNTPIMSQSTVTTANWCFTPIHIP